LATRKFNKTINKENSEKFLKGKEPKAADGPPPPGGPDEDAGKP